MARNWNGSRMRSRMRRNGSEDARELPMAMRPLWSPRPRAPAIPKSELRGEATAAFESFAGTITKLPTIVPLSCGRCGHQGKARVPAGQPAPRFRCSKCGAKNGQHE